MGRALAVVRRLFEDRGFTVIEMSVATGLFFLILVAALTVLESGTKTERGQAARHDALEVLRRAQDLFARDARQAISLAPASTTSKFDMQSYVNGTQRHIVYTVASGELRRSVDGSAYSVLATRITDPTPFCYDTDTGCAASGPVPSTSAVRVTFAGTPDVSKAPAITLETDIQLRNTGG